MDYVPAAFLTAILRIRIDDDLGDGLEVGHGLLLTNNRERITGLLTPRFKEVIGHLESEALLNAPAVVFMFAAVSTAELGSSFMDRLNDFLYRTQRLLGGLWLQKDNSADFELGFFEAPHRANPSRISSNYLAVSTTCADGSLRVEPFSRSDLEYIGRLIGSRFQPDVVPPGPRTPRVSRLARALYLVQAARAQPELSLKVAFYCMCFEALFSTATTELAHKLSERVAYFVAPDLDRRRVTYERMKEAYSVRSTVLHGDVVPKKLSAKLEEASTFCDDTLRSVFTMIFSSDDVGSVFASTSGRLEAWLRDLTLGVIRSPTAAA